MSNDGGQAFKKRIPQYARNPYTGIFEGAAINPVEREIKDLERWRNFAYNVYPIIPFFDRGDATLEFFKWLRMLSPTNGGIIGTMKPFVLGEGVDVVKRPPHGWKVSRADRQVSDSEFDGFAETLAELGMKGETLDYLAESIYENYKPYGNAFVEVVLTQADGQRGGQIHCHDVHNIRYYLPLRDDEPKAVWISKLWDYEYLVRNTPKLIPLYPNFYEDEDGTRRTMLHMKNKISDYDWYGVPDWLGAMYYAFIEVQMGQYTTESYARDFVAKVFMEYEAALSDFIPDDGDSEQLLDIDEGFVEAIRTVFTNRAGPEDKRSVLFRARAPESEPTTVHEFKPNQGHEFHEVTARVAEQNLIKAHKWHPALMTSTPGSLGESKQIYELVKFKQATVIGPLQSQISKVINQGLDIILEWAGKEEMRDFGIGFSNLFQDMLMQEEEAEPDTPTEPAEDRVTDAN